MLLAGGGSGIVRPLSALALIGVAGLAWLASLSGRFEVAALGRAGRWVVLAATLLSGWVGLSLVWSIEPDVSWDRLNVALVVLAALALGVFVGANARSLRPLTAALGVALGLALAWALAAVVVPSLAPVGDRIGRLSEPIGYWNALALVADLAVAIALWALTELRWRAAWPGAVSLLFAAVVVLLMTQSRAGLVSALVVGALMLARGPHRVEHAALAACAAVPAVGVAGWAFTRDALSRDAAGRAAREADARWFALVLVVGFVCALAAAWRLRVSRVADERPQRVRQALVCVGGAVVVAGAIALVASVGNPAAWARDQIGVGACANDPNRITSFCDNNRLSWWADALEIAQDEPLLGTGAGTYGTARLGVRDDGLPVGEPHSVPLQVLSDLGIVGLALLAGLVAAAVLACRRALRRVREPEEMAARALVCVPLAFALHSLVDYDLNFVAAAGPAALVLGVLLSFGAETSRVSAGVTLGPVVLALLVLACGSVLLPDLARRAVIAVYGADDISSAAAQARRARSLNPLSLDAIAAQAFVAERAGSLERSVELLEEGTRMQPRNPASWLALARFHYALSPPDYCRAYEAFNEAYTLDQRSARWVPGGPLDVARAAVNAGACEPRD